MKYKNWDNFLVHCSGIEEIMSKPLQCRGLTEKQRIDKAKLSIKEQLSESESEKLAKIIAKEARFNDPELSAKAIKYLIRRYAIEKYNKKIAATGQLRVYAQKGNTLEPQALKIISEMDGVQYVKPDEAISNDFILGRCDAMLPDKIVDIKISWNSVTFLTARNVKLPKKYWYQMQGYLWLYDRPYGEVKYVLINTPEHLADRERLRQTEKYMFGEIDKDAYDDKLEELDTCYDYDSIPTRRRVITFGIPRNDEAISKITRRVELSRQWLNEFEKVHLMNKNIITLPEQYIDVPEEDSIELDTANPRESD